MEIIHKVLYAEIKQVQEEFGGAFNTKTPELARLNLFVNDFLERQLSGGELEKRKKVG